MKLKDLMTTQLETARPDDTVRQVADRMASRDIGALPVVDGDKPLGIVTDRDIAIRAVARGKDPEKTHVREVMTETVESLASDQDVRDAARLMQERKIRRLLVTDDGRLSGIVALADLARHVEDDALKGEVLQQVSQPG